MATGLDFEEAKAAVRALPSSVRKSDMAALTPEDLTQMTTDLKQRDNARAVAAYEEGLSHDPQSAALASGLAAARERL